MGSVIDYVKCPQCFYPKAISDLDYRTGEEYIFCPRCGYDYKRIALVDRIRQKKDPNHPEYYKLNKRGQRIYREYTHPGYGVIAVFAKGSFRRLASIRKPVVKEGMLAKWLKFMILNDINMEKSYATIADPVSSEVEFLIGEEEML